MCDSDQISTRLAGDILEYAIRGLAESEAVAGGEVMDEIAFLQPEGSGQHPELLMLEGVCGSRIGDTGAGRHFDLGQPEHS